MHHWKTQVLFQKRSGELCSRKPLSGSLTHGINITNYHTMCKAQRLIAEGQMGAVEVNTAFCWRTRVRAEHAKLQWPGESDLPQDEPSAETQHVSTPSSIKGWGATTVSPAAHMLLSRMMLRGPAPPVSLRPCSWGSPAWALKGWSPFVVPKPLPPLLAELKHLFLFLFSPSAIPGAGLCLSECVGILRKLLSGLWRCHKYEAIFHKVSS